MCFVVNAQQETGEFEDKEKMKKMDKMLAFWQDKVIHRVAGHQVWSETKKCYNLLSTASDPPTDSNPNPKPWITPTTEAFAMLAIENYFNRWVLRAKHGIKNPDLKIYKKADGSFIAGLEGFKGEYTSPNGGVQPFGGYTEAGVDRLVNMTERIEENRKNNAEYIKRIEQRVLAIVYKKNRRKNIDENKSKRRKTSVVQMAKPDEDVRIEDINLDDDKF